MPLQTLAKIQNAFGIWDRSNGRDPDDDGSARRGLNLVYKVRCRCDLD